MKVRSVVLPAIVLALAGCGGTGVAKQAANPQTRAEVAKGEAIAKACLIKSKTPKGFAHCVAPKGHEAALEACVKKAFIHDIPLHKSQITSDLGECVVKNR